MMAEKGGWDNMSFEKKATNARHLVSKTRPTTTKHSVGGRKRKVSPEDEGQSLAPRRKSLRSRG